MKPNNSLVRSNQNPVSRIKSLASDPKYIKRFEEVIGKKTPQFLASVVTAVKNNPMLSQADPDSVMASAMIAATLNLDIDPNLGFAAIIPYKRNRKLPDGTWSSTVDAQFQIMVKGFVQLALRSGQYRNINVAEIYLDELVSEDIITGEIQINPVGNGDRSHGRTNNIAGYVAYLEFINGFRKMVFWSTEKILLHAQKFSKSFDSKTGKFYKNSAWDDHYEAMCRKTVLKHALSNWGILSTQMQESIIADEGFKKSIDSDLEHYSDAEEYLPEAETPEEDRDGTTEAKPLEKPKVEPTDEEEQLQEEFGFDIESVFDNA